LYLVTTLFTITTAREEIEHLSRIKPMTPFQKHYQVYPGDAVPVCCHIDGKMKWISAVRGIQHHRMHLTSISMEKILVRKPFNIWFRKYRCAIPVNCFFTHQDEKVHLTRILKQRTFMLGGMCLPPDAENTDYRFILLEVEAADILKRITDTMPINFSCHIATSWCTQETILNVMQLADGSGDRWFDFYKVDAAILASGSNDKELLKPKGISYREWIEREEKLNSLDLKGERFDRNNTKGRH
jgi:putative SOS response-associated peptidase YedK